MSGDVSIRTAAPSDAAAIQSIYMPYVAETAISFEVDVPSVASMAERMASVVDAGLPYLVAERGGMVLGYAYAGPHRTRAAYRFAVDVTAYVVPDHRGGGIGTALYTELLHRLSATEAHAAFAGITLPNERSVALHEKVGFTPVGVFREVGWKFDRWHDVGWWQRRLR